MIKYLTGKSLAGVLTVCIGMAYQDYSTALRAGELLVFQVFSVKK